MSTKQIRGLDFGRTAGAELISDAHGIWSGISTHPTIFVNPPIDLNVLKTTIDKYQVAVNEAKDGGKKAILERNKQRDALIEMLRVLARYVEMISKNDMATFLLSGFKPAATTRNPAQPLPAATIKKVAPGSPGELLVIVKPIRRALSYDVRSAPIGAGGLPGTWVTATFTSAKTAMPITGLTPGTNYAFQVRALGKLGYTPWSDSVTHICA